MTVNEINQRIRQFRDERNWMPFHRPKDMASAIAIEAGELMEHFLWKSDQECEERVRTHREAIQDEIADIAMYLFELADNLGIDLLQAMDSKMAKNAAKYPVEKARGSHQKYTEFS